MRLQLQDHFYRGISDIWHEVNMPLRQDQGLYYRSRLSILNRIIRLIGVDRVERGS